MSFDRAYDMTFGFEKGFSNVSADPGGPTQNGVTQAVYDAFRVAAGKPKQDVRLMIDAEERALFHDNYWTPCNCDALPENLAVAVFDMAVNSGVWNAKLALQRAVCVQADGVIGPQTIAAANSTPDVVLEFLRQRAALIGEILATKPSQAIFAHGWIVRLLEQAWALK